MWKAEYALNRLYQYRGSRTNSKRPPKSQNRKRTKKLNRRKTKQLQKTQNNKPNALEHTLQTSPEELQDIHNFLRTKYENDSLLDVNLYTKKPSYRCGRCQIDTRIPSTCNGKVSHALGGMYGGVVCPYHMICQDCWWYPDTEQSLICMPVAYKKGTRAKEEDSTIDLPLWKGPFNREVKKCPGCRLGMEMHTEKAKHMYTVNESNKTATVIDIDDEADYDTEDNTIEDSVTIHSDNNDPDIRITFKMKSQEGKIINVDMPINTTFEELYKKYNLLSIVDVDGEHVEKNKTPAQKGIQDDDTLTMVL